MFELARLLFFAAHNENAKKKHLRKWCYQLINTHPNWRTECHKCRCESLHPSKKRMTFKLPTPGPLVLTVRFRNFPPFNPSNPSQPTRGILLSKDRTYFEPPKTNSNTCWNPGGGICLPQMSCWKLVTA